MTDCIREELVNGKDECFNKVVQYLDEKSDEYYRRLCEVFGSTEYFEHFKQCYENSVSPDVDNQALSPLHEHLCAILEWRSLLATEVEALQAMKTEIEDYPKDFEIQIRLSESLHEQNRLRRELETLKEQAERLQMENDAYNAIVDEVKKDCNEKVAEANERAKKAEKAFIDLTRHRSVNQTSESSTLASKPPDAALQKRTSETMLNAMSPFSFKSSMDKVQSSSSRFKAYSTLTWEGFDSLDEDSSEEEGKATPVSKPIAIPVELEPEVVEPPPSKTAKLEEVTPSIPTPPRKEDELPKTPKEEKRPSTPESFVTELPKLDASPIRPAKLPGPEDTIDETEKNIRTSLSSTPRKSLPVTPHQAEEVSTLEPSTAAVPSPNPHSPMVASSHIKSLNSIAEVFADSAGSDVVDKAAYLQLYDKYLDLQSELERVNSRREQSVANNTDALSSGVVPGNELGLTTQLNDLRDQYFNLILFRLRLTIAFRKAFDSLLERSEIARSVFVGAPPVCDIEGHQADLASSARISGGNIFSTIPNTPKHFTDWSISLDQTNASNAAIDTSDNDLEGHDGAVKALRPSLGASGVLFKIIDAVIAVMKSSEFVAYKSGRIHQSRTNLIGIVAEECFYYHLLASSDSLTDDISLPSSSLLSISVGQQTDLSLLCANCSSDSVNTHSGLVPLQEVSPSALGVHMLSPASTLQELNVDFSESTARQGSGLEIVESACSPIPGLTPKSKDASAECHLTTEALREKNRELSDSLTGAAGICADILRRLSTLRSDVPLHSTDNTDDALNNDAIDLKSTLRKLASQPSYMAEITKLREKLEEAERMIEAKSPFDAQLKKMEDAAFGNCLIEMAFPNFFIKINFVDDASRSRSVVVVQLVDVSSKAGLKSHLALDMDSGLPPIISGFRIRMQFQLL
ncbi:hypothetical protein ACTXT7_008267 [Hymenolepis weldensis]